MAFSCSLAVSTTTSEWRSRYLRFGIIRRFRCCYRAHRQGVSCAQPSLLCSTPEQLDMLVKYGRIFYLDTTFNRVGHSSSPECIFVGNYHLTTLMVSVNGTGVPVALLVHTSMTKELYAEMLNDLVRLSNGRFRPDIVLCDFADAIRAAAHMVFPHIKPVGDKFHLAQARRFHSYLFIGCANFQLTACWWQCRRFFAMRNSTTLWTAVRRCVAM